jgi:hypothetical protein
VGYGLMIWEMTVSTRSSVISILDILSLCGECSSRRPEENLSISH